MSNLAVISLFAGVGGFDLAAHNAGIPTIAAVEIDDHARGVLAHRFPNTRLYTDVTTVSGIELKGDHDGDVVLTGGFPCQDLSVAGKRAGLGGERSGLFWHIIRIAQEIQPKWLILENVPGLLSSNNGRDMGTVIGALVESGYGIAYRILDAQYFGVPQRRRRVFIVGCFGDNGRASAEILALIESSAGNLETGKPQRQDTAGTPTNSIGDTFTAAGHGTYINGIGTLRANGGDLGGGSETLLVPSAPATTRESAINMLLKTNSSLIGCD